MRYDAIISLSTLFPLLFSRGGLATPSKKRDDPAKPAVGRAELEDAMSSWPPHLKYFPEEQSTSQEIRKREAVAGIIRDGIKPVAVKALRPDENDMFWPEYWGFDTKLDVTPLINLRTKVGRKETCQPLWHMGRRLKSMVSNCRHMMEEELQREHWRFCRRGILIVRLVLRHVPR